VKDLRSFEFASLVNVFFAVTSCFAIEKPQAQMQTCAFQSCSCSPWLLISDSGSEAVQGPLQLDVQFSVFEVYIDSYSFLIQGLYTFPKTHAQLPWIRFSNNEFQQWSVMCSFFTDLRTINQNHISTQSFQRSHKSKYFHVFASNTSASSVEYRTMWPQTRSISRQEHRPRIRKACFGLWDVRRRLRAMYSLLASFLANSTSTSAAVIILNAVAFLTRYFLLARAQNSSGASSYSPPPVRGSRYSTARLLAEIIPSLPQQALLPEYALLQYQNLTG
jgi:hypothetical protein